MPAGRISAGEYSASGESEAYVDTVRNTYEGSFGCGCEVLRLKEGGDDAHAIQRKIHDADIIYVGGGNTRMMLAEWKKCGLDSLLREAHGRGVILTGLSAGAVCWFEKAVSDSNSFEGGEEWEYCHVDCLGFLAVSLSPHYEARKAEDRFWRFMRTTSGRTLAIDDICALVNEGDRFRVLRARPDANAYVITSHEGKLVEEVLEDSGEARRLH